MSLARNTTQDWLAFSLTVLVNKGPDSLKIDPLCRLKGVSKGSFYHHFQNRAAFIDQLMDYWFEKMTMDFIAQANEQASPIERLERLDQVIAGSNIEAELHIRAWALKEPSISGHLAKIDAQRQQYLASCYIELGMDVVQANDVSMLAYASFLGLQQIHPKPSIDTILRISALGSTTFLKDLS